MSGRIRPSPPALVCAPQVSFVPFLSPSLSLFSSSRSIHLPLILPPHTVWWGAKDVCASQGAPRWGRVPDKVTATKRWFLFLSLSSPRSLPPPFICLPSSSSCLSLFPFFITVPSFSFSFPPHLESSLRSLFLSLFPSSQRGSHLGECVASSNAPSRITINYLLRYLSPSTSSCPVLHPAIYMVFGPMRRVTLREEMKDFHCARNRSSARFSTSSAIFLRLSSLPSYLLRRISQCLNPSACAPSRFQIDR